MPKRQLSVTTVAETESGSERTPRKRGFLKRLSMRAGFVKPPTPGESSPPAGYTRGSVTVAMQAMKQRKSVTVDATMNDITMAFAHQASIVNLTTAPAAQEKVRPREPGQNPAELPPVHVVGPAKGKKHSATLILLHGFTCSGRSLAHELLPTLREKLMPSAFGSLKFVFLTAPQRRVSCYADPDQVENAWHDYFTDHGGAEGHPEIEEEIDVGQLEWTKAAVHRIIDTEVALLGGDHKRIALLGQSQGSCTALHCTLTYPKAIAGVLCSIGQLYSHTPVPADRKDQLQVFTFVSAMRMPRLLEAPGNLWPSFLEAAGNLWPSALAFAFAFAAAAAAAAAAH